MADPRDDPIDLVESRFDEWRERFAAERDRVEAALGERGLAGALRRIDHVGSTAVPGLAAKDVVDLDVVVADGAVAEASAALAAALGGDRDENRPTWHPVYRRHGGQRFNDHVFARSDDGWRVSVATREALRADPELRADYEARKRELAAAHDDLTAYSVGKTDLVRRALDRARAADVDLGFAVPELPAEHGPEE